MGKNSLYTLPEAWEAITKVKSEYNRKKLEEIYHMAAWFIPMYQDKPVQVLLTPHFAQHYLPILRKIISQGAGKKFLLSFSANPWVGVTKSIQWFIWMPTRIGSKAAMNLLQSYITELEKQAIVPHPKVFCSIMTQTDFPSPGVSVTNDTDNGNGGDDDQDNAEPMVPELPPSDTDAEPVVPELPPSDDNDPPAGSLNLFVTNEENDLQNETAMTSGVACGQDSDGFNSSSGSVEDMILARALELSQLDDTTDPGVHSPTAQASPMKLSTPARPTKLTKGSRKSDLKDSGINFTTAGILEASRRERNASRDQSEDIHPDFTLVEIEETAAEYDLTNDDDVFEENEVPEEESWEELPDLE